MRKFVIYILSALTLMFVGLKLSDKIDWSWLWVFSPVWIPIVLWIVVNVFFTTYNIRMYKKDPNFRRQVDFYNEQKRRENMTLSERLADMQKQAEKMERQANIGKL